MSFDTLDAHIPAGPIADMWDDHKFDVKLVNPANKRRFKIIVVGTGLAGASAAATLDGDAGAFAGDALLITDLNGDGAAELLVAAPGAPGRDGQAGAGSVSVYWGDAD